MLGRKAIINFLLLFLLCIYSRHYNAPALSATSNTPLASNILSGPAAPPIICKHSIQTEQVRLRYIGGEYNFQVTLLQPEIATLRFTDSKVFSADYFIALSNRHFLFKLRGPPAACVPWC